MPPSPKRKKPVSAAAPLPEEDTAEPDLQTPSSPIHGDVGDSSGGLRRSPRRRTVTTVVAKGTESDSDTAGDSSDETTEPPSRPVDGKSAQARTRQSPRKTSETAAKMSKGPSAPSLPSWICIQRRPIADDVRTKATTHQENASQSRFLSLPHPRTGEPGRYLLQDGGRTLLEATQLDDGRRSWFWGDHVIEDGRLFLLTPMHPNFLLLPVLERAGRKRGAAQDAGMFVQMEDFLRDDQNPGLAALNGLTLLSDLAHLCEVKHMHGLELYRFNADRALQWLQGRFQAVHEALRGLQSLDISQSNDLASTAFHLVCEYLSDPWVERLQSAIDPHGDASKANADPPGASGGTNVAANVVVAPLEDYSRKDALPAKVDKKAKMTVGQKALATVDVSSMRKLTAFFKGPSS